jgi:hypothetical protein
MKPIEYLRLARMEPCTGGSSGIKKRGKPNTKGTRIITKIYLIFSSTVTSGTRHILYAESCVSVVCKIQRYKSVNYLLGQWANTQCVLVWNWLQKYKGHPAYAPWQCHTRSLNTFEQSS